MTDKDTVLSLEQTLRLALEALEKMQNAIYNIGGEHVIDLNFAIEQADVSEFAITAIKAALSGEAQQVKDEPEYYGLTKDHLWMSISKEHYDRLKPEFRMACYTTPPQRKPLTDEEIMDALKLKSCDGYRAIVRAIEAAHGIIDPTDLKGEA